MKNYWEMLKQRGVIPPDVMDYIAVEHILNFIVSGVDNEFISIIAEVDLKYVIEVSNEFLGFNGFSYPLDFQPITAYNSTVNKKEFVKYIDGLELDYGSYTSDVIYEVCKRYAEIERRIEEYYAKC